MIKSDREYRNFNSFECRAKEDEGNSYIVTGYASTFDPYVMCNIDGVDYFERIEPTAFDEADLQDVVFLCDHTGTVFARTKNGAVKLSIDEHGLHTVADLSLTAAAREMYEGIKVGNYQQMSFAFTVEADHFDIEARTRVIDRVRKVYDVSAVSFPANPGTDIGVSMRDYFNGAIEAAKEAERLQQEAEARAEAKAKLMERVNKLVHKEDEN